MSGNGVSVKMKTVDLEAQFNAALRRYFTRIMLSGHKAAVASAPVDKGILRGSMAPGGGSTRVDTANPPQWAIVESPLKTPADKKGRPYGRILEESPNTHYRRGPHQGKPTKGWLSNIRGTIAPDIKMHLDAMKKELESGWKRG